MGDLTANFWLSEFERGVEIPRPLLWNVRHLADDLQVVRGEVGDRIIIISGYRTPAQNAAGGGEDQSYHLDALAADFRTPSLEPPALRELILRLIKEGRIRDGGVGLYRPGGKYGSGWVHYDHGRPGRRWEKG